jgi:hypothetical protein
MGGSKIKAFLWIALLANLLSGTANAAEIPYTVAAGPNEQLTGIVYLDDSSGDAESVKGAASGVVNGEYALDSLNTRTEMPGTGFRLSVIFDRKGGQLSAHLDTCPASSNGCDAGRTVILWEKD